MRWIRYEGPNGIRYGIVEGRTIAEVDTTPFAQWRRTGATAELDRVKTLVPVIPGTFYAIGSNYAAHAATFADITAARTARPARPQPGYRANNALIADGEEIVIPALSEAGIQYEGELVAVIGKRARYVSEADAPAVVLGYTIGNDVSERAWQKADSGLWRSKNADTFNPMGPWIETDVDLPTLMTRVRVNGVQQLEFRTGDMFFSVAQCIAEISKYMTLHPGDVMWMGTEGSNADLKAGDVCEVELDQIGVLRNPVVAERR